MTSYRTFWVVCSLYFVTLAFATASGMEFIRWAIGALKLLGPEIDVDRIPFYHFPDVWMNLIWFSGWLKIILAIMVVISVTNEFSYRTLRQNVIDGMSRWEFILSKILTNVLLSFMSVFMIFIIGLVTGFIYSPEFSLDKVFTDLEFFIAYFLEIFFFLSYALLMSVVIQRSGLTIIVVLLSQMIELIITKNLDETIPGVIPYFPMKSIWYLIECPYPRYIFMEIQDQLDPIRVAVVVVWIVLFNYLAYFKLKRSDI